MKTLLFPLFITLMACQSSSVGINGNELKYKETISIHDVPKASLTFYDVNDSRCPEGMQCIWAGNATVDLALEGVNTEGKIVKHINLCLGDCRTIYPQTPFRQTDTVDVDFTGQQYRFILEKVSPSPKTDPATAKNDYSILLKIEKK